MKVRFPVARLAITALGIYWGAVAIVDAERKHWVLLVIDLVVVGLSLHWLNSTFKDGNE